MNPLQRDVLARFPAPRVGAPTSKCPATVALVYIRFTSDHGLLTDKFRDSKEKNADLDRWTPGGTKYKNRFPKDWGRWPPHSFPISHTKQKKIQLVAEFEVGPKTVRPGQALVDIDGGADYVKFTGKAQFRAASKKNAIKVSLTAKAPLPDKIQKLTLSFTWKVDFCGQQFVGISGPHIIYVTYGTPAPEDDDPEKGGTPEPLGVTLKRMDAAMRLVEPVDTTSPPKYEIPAVPPYKAKMIQLNREQNIVRHLMTGFKRYTLKEDKSLKEFKHPNFINQPTGGAWPLDDFRVESGECQAMVRFVRNVLKQLGIPGTAEAIVVYADKDKPYPARENAKGNDYPWDFQINGTTLQKALTDQEVTAADIGKTYSQDGPIGFNQFEACLKYTYPPGSRPLYYPGGGGADIIFENADQVLRSSFANFVEAERLTNPNDPSQVDYKLTKILVTYPR